MTSATTRPFKTLSPDSVFNFLDNMTTLITAEEQEAIELVLQALDAIRNGKTPTKKSLAALSNHTMACTVFLASYSGPKQQ